MSKTLEFFANITLRVIMIIFAIVLIPVARDLLSDKKYVKGFALLVAIACLALFKFSFIFD